MEQIKSKYIILVVVIIVALLTVFTLFKLKPELFSVIAPEGFVPNSDINVPNGDSQNENVILPISAVLKDPEVEVQKSGMVVRLPWEIDWDANPEFLMYKIYRDTDSDFSVGAVPIVEITLKDRREYFDLPPSVQTYYYKLVVIDKDGQRANSNIATAKP